MGGFSLIHWLILGLFVLLLFGGSRFSSMMGDVAKGLKSFKQGMSDDDRPQDPRLAPPPLQPTPFQNPLPPYGQQPPPQQPHTPQEPPRTVEVSPQPEPQPPLDPDMSPPRGVPPADDRAH